MFDQWDHTLQTGNDTEYTFVIIALCVGVAYSLKWFVPRLSLPDSQTVSISYPHPHPLFSGLKQWSSMIAISVSPPAAALRI